MESFGMGMIIGRALISPDRKLNEKREDVTKAQSFIGIAVCHDISLRGHTTRFYLPLYTQHLEYMCAASMDKQHRPPARPLFENAQNFPTITKEVYLIYVIELGPTKLSILSTWQFQCKDESRLKITPSF